MSERADSEQVLSDLVKPKEPSQPIFGFQEHRRAVRGSRLGEYIP